MSRKRKAPVRKVYPDPKFHSEVVSKFINSIMYDGKRSTAEKILYDALDKIKSKNNEDPLKIFNTAISNVKPNLECRSRRVGGATYQVPVEVKSKRAQALALRWLMDATRKRKNKTMADKLYSEILDASQNKGSAIKKREDTHKMAEANKAFAHFRWLMDATRKRKNKTMADKLYAELMDAAQNKGSAIKKREDTHKMAESNKAFAHFRW